MKLSQIRETNMLIGTVINCFLINSFSQVNLAHSNASHSVYVALGEGASSGLVEGLVVPRSDLSSAPASEHRRDWILLPVTFKQLKQVFRQEI